MHVSDHFWGRVDVVPGVCHIATEFVCVWFLPVLPRRSVLFYREGLLLEGWGTRSVRLSLRSVLVGYAWPFFLFLLGVGASFPFALAGQVKPDNQTSFLLVSAAFLGIPCLAVALLWKLRTASPMRRQYLAGLKGLPPHVAESIREGILVSGGPVTGEDPSTQK